jgi:hypothetical protein
MGLVEIRLEDAEHEFPGCSQTPVTLCTVWRHPTTGFVRKHLVARTDDGGALFWDDIIRAWCTIWAVSTWGGFVRFGSREWLDERLRYALGRNGNSEIPTV